MAGEQKLQASVIVTQEKSKQNLTVADVVVASPVVDELADITVVVCAIALLDVLEHAGLGAEAQSHEQVHMVHPACDVLNVEGSTVEDVVGDGVVVGGEVAIGVVEDVVGN